MYSERCTRRERGRQGDTVPDTGTREPSAVGLSCHLRNVGKVGTLLEDDNRSRALIKGKLDKAVQGCLLSGEMV